MLDVRETDLFQDAGAAAAILEVDLLERFDGDLYDGMGRAVKTTLSSWGDKKWDTDTTYTGDSVATTSVVRWSSGS